MVERLMDDPSPDAREHVTEATDVEKARRGIRAGGAQEDMVALMLAEHIVDEIGGDGDLTTRFLLAGKTALDQARNDRAGAKRAFHERGFGEPSLEIVAQHVYVEQFCKDELTAVDP